jgi:hypothetical protein
MNAPGPLETLVRSIRKDCPGIGLAHVNAFRAFRRNVGGGPCRETPHLLAEISRRHPHESHPISPVFVIGRTVSSDRVNKRQYAKACRFGRHIGQTDRSSLFPKRLRGI